MARVEDLAPEQISRIYHEVFNSESGAIVLQDLENRCFAHITTAPDNIQVDPYSVLKNEGRRSVLLHIKTMLQPPEMAESEK